MFCEDLSLTNLGGLFEGAEILNTNTGVGTGPWKDEANQCPFRRTEPRERRQDFGKWKEKGDENNSKKDDLLKLIQFGWGVNKCLQLGACEY